MAERVVLTREQKTLVEKNVGLAQKISHDYAAKSSEINIEDVVSAAYTGLISAALTFDPKADFIREGDLENGKAFAGWARLKINGAILDWQKSSDYVQRSYRRTYKRLQDLGYRRTKTMRDLPELSTAVDIPVDKLRVIIAAIEHTSMSLDESLPDKEGNSGQELGHLAPSRHNVEASVLETSITQAVGEAHLTLLTPLQQEVIARRYYGHQELQFIAQDLDVSLTEVRDAHTEGVLILHKAMVSQVHSSH